MSSTPGQLGEAHSRVQALRPFNAGFYLIGSQALMQPGHQLQGHGVSCRTRSTQACQGIKQEFSLISAALSGLTVQVLHFHFGPG